MKTLSGIALLIILVAATNLQAADSYCGELDNIGQFGPYDYTDPLNNTNLRLVESAHFTSNVKRLQSGNTSAFVGADIDYTLRSFPNHHPALIAMTKLSFKEKTSRPKGAKYSIECYFDRAIRFKPGDGIARMVYGNYLLQLDGRRDDAFEQYHEAVRIQPENANINYNLGLIYMKRKDYEQSIVYAKKAYELGFPLPGLRNKLMKTGKWDGNLDENIDVEP